MGNLRNAIGHSDSDHLGRWAPRIPTVLFLALALAFLVFISTRFDVDPGAVRRAITQSDPVLYLLGMALYYLSFLGGTSYFRRWNR